MSTNNSIILLENGEIFEGLSFGKDNDDIISAEIVFQTGMVGYPESLTDPSYKNQIIVFTFPMIGNYGVPNNEKNKYGILQNFESDKIHVAGLIIDNLFDNNTHWKSTKSLNDWLIENDIPGVYNIDTRKLTKIIREKGTMGGHIMSKKNYEDNFKNKNIKYKIEDKHLVDLVSTKEIIEFNQESKLNVLVIDCGIKNSQITMLLERRVNLKIVPWNYDFTKLTFDRIFISNGPGNPEDCHQLIDRLKNFMKYCEMNDKIIPIFGICLGHQILALASDAKTFKMKYGNRGLNIPCRLHGTKKCIITSQNHGYSVDSESLGDQWLPLFINENDGSNEGIIHKKYPYFSVQFHPEGNAGPLESSFLFDIFIDNKIDIFRKNINEEKEKTFNLEWLNNTKKVLILGSGGLNIGQSGEFDYSGSQAIKAYKEEGLTVILINPNIATIQTSTDLTDKVYFLPINFENVLKVIEAEWPNFISISFGGQTALNCGVELYKKNIFTKYNIEVLGTSIETVIDTEDRGRFTKKLEQFNEKFIINSTVSNIEDGIIVAKKIGFPVLVRSAFSLGGLGSGFANDEHELISLLKNSFSRSIQVIIDKSMRGWKEIEYEVVRDKFNNCITVCNMENIDPLGIHTGESIVVAPSQTLSNEEYYMLRDVAIKTIRNFGIIGECNIQYALNPLSKEYYIIEINARLSRSSALASKATGYPLAYIAAKLSLGYSLVDLKNSITKNTTACFEPSLDYCVVKMPRWDLQKFGSKVKTKINTSMKSIGESMAISRNFNEAFQKSIRMANESQIGFNPINLGNKRLSKEELKDELENPNYNRIFFLAFALYNDIFSIDELYNLTHIDKWFLNNFNDIIKIRKQLENLESLDQLDSIILRKAKMNGFSDKQISNCIGTTELVTREKRFKLQILPFVKQIDTVSAEFPCYTNYLYLTYSGIEHDIKFDQSEDKIIVLGSGVYKIGSSVEFDWCSVNCIRELRKLGKNSIVINCNPETVSTDYDEADKLYFEELSFETTMDIYQLENPSGIILSMGGQLPNNIAIPLFRQNIKILGTSPEMIDNAENRYKFSRMLDILKIDQPVWKELTSIDEAVEFCNKVGYPCLVRPSYVLSGMAMNVAYSNKDLIEYLGTAVSVSKDHPVVISKFITDAKEIEIDAVSKNGEIVVIAISEHVENAGVHSGDSTLILPTQDVTDETKTKIIKSVEMISQSLNINGPFNIQFMAKDNEVKVIECNLRVSRSFPFVSKTLGINFIKIATRCILGMDVERKYKTYDKRNDIIGVKVPKFSFDRLEGADISLGVEMLSTGEVACFGKTKYEAFLKAIVASGFKIPKNGILLSIGSHKFKEEFLESAKILEKFGFKLYGTYGTTDYYKHCGVNITELTIEGTKESILEIISSTKTIDLVINISVQNKLRSSDSNTIGYKIRRQAIESNIPVITDIKFAKLFVKSIEFYNNQVDFPLNTEIDCLTSYKILRLPGLIDVHVHMREPGANHKEDWESGTMAALNGGFTTVLVMPNTDPSVIDLQSLELVEKLAKEKAFCDYGLFVGANNNNVETISSLAFSKGSSNNRRVTGLKMYLNNTYGTLKLDNIMDWYNHIKKWPSNLPICVHAESQTLSAVLHICNILKKKIHICHVAKKEEIELIKMSKNFGMDVTCEITPHHLFLSVKDLEHLGCCGNVKPSLMTIEDQQALWDNIDIIDCFATDHAPHTLEEKNKENIPGFPGLETSLYLLLNAVKEKRLTLDDIILRYHTNPSKIFGIPVDKDTYIEINIDKEWIIPSRMKYSKSGWTPFEGMKAVGEIKRVVLRGKPVMIDGHIIGKKGYGKNIIKIKGDSKKIFEKKVDDDYSVFELKNNWDNYQLRLKNVLSVDQFTKNDLRYLFHISFKMKNLVEKNEFETLEKVLKGKIISSIFYEPSTRTSQSFASAIERLGGKVREIHKEFSSIQKGESLLDTMKTLESYSDLIIIRSPIAGSILECEPFINIPIINAGDGIGEHPTQALLDMFTIREERGTVNNLNITMLGDLKNGRTVHSLAKLLALYNIRFRYVSPSSLRMPEDIKEYIKERGLEQSEHEKLEDVLETTDVLYVTRIQKERFQSMEEYERLKDSYVITSKKLAFAKENLVIMHPLPRNNEISTEIDSDPRAAYFRQMKNGMYVRMALLSIIFDYKIKKI